MKRNIIAFVLLVVVVIITVAAYYAYVEYDIATSNEDHGFIIFLSKILAAIWGIAIIGVEVIAYQVISYFFINKRRHGDEHRRLVIALIVLAVISIVSLPFVWFLTIVEIIIFFVELIYLISWIKHRSRTKALTAEKSQQ